MGDVSPVGVVRARAALDRGIAANADGRPAEASRHFRAVLRAVGDGTDDAGGEATERAYLRARAMLGLVASDFELRADIPRSLEMLEEAERWASLAGADDARVPVLGQAGHLWLRAGDGDRALAALDAAAALIDRAAPRDACVVLLNRGSLHLDRGDVPRARADLEDCAARADAIGNRAMAYKARHNLGYAEFLAGDLPRALHSMSRAAEDSGGLTSGIPLLDRARVLLEAGLVSEADDTLRQAGEVFAAGRLTLDLAQVEIARAECALLLHRPDAARGWASAASRRLARRANAPWLARAELTELRARLDLALEQPDPRRACLSVARRAAALARRVEESGGSREVVRTAHVSRAAALIGAGRRAEAREALVAAGRLTGRESLSLALAARAVAAQLAFDAGRRADGHRHVDAGQLLLAAHRSQFGSVEAVTAAAVLGERLAVIEARAALERGDPLALLDAVERGRATFAGPARVRPPDDAELARLLVDLRLAVERDRAQEGSDPVLAREIDRLRTAARQRSWQLDGEVGAPQPPRAADLLAEAATGRVTIVDLTAPDGVVRAVVLDAAGARLHHLAAAADVEQVARRVDADLHALSGEHLPDAMRAVVRRSFDRGLAWLDENLLGPLDVSGPAHLVVGGPMVALPWGLLPSRRGVATSVGTRLAATVAAARRPGALVVAGPGLVHAEDEVAAVAGTWDGARVLAGDGATTAATAGLLGRAGVVHLAVHGHHEPDNPLFSWVRLADGPLFAHELEGTDLSGSVVVLSACEVGRATVRPGGEVLGLASVLLRLGAEAVVAALAPLRDEVAALVAPAFHRALREGAGPAAALASVDAGTDEQVPLACFATRAGSG